MRSGVSFLPSPLTGSPIFISNSRPKTPAALLGGHGISKKLTPRRATSVEIMNPRSEQRHRESLGEARPIGSPEPPWLVFPPVAPRNPFSGEARLFDFQVKGSITQIPFSLRLVQMMRKKRRLSRPEDCAELGPFGNAIWSLARMLEELQRSVLPADGEAEEEALARVSRDPADSFVWLFWRVFYTSPNLAVRLLVLTSDFIVASTEAAAAAVPIARKDICPPPEKIGRYGCWSDIRILNTTESRSLDSHRKRRMAYELMIVTEKANSMILSNYAQLLYKYEKDIDRAEEYFRRSVRAEPVDGEARSRYALFLWEERADTEGAEEMFLEAIEADPGNVYHRSNYAWFLLRTGGLEDTCYPLDGGADSDGDGDGDGIALSEL